MVEEIIKRIEELTRNIEQSAANHNMLVGCLQEAKNMYQVIMTKEEKKEPEDIIE